MERFREAFGQCCAARALRAALRAALHAALRDALRADVEAQALDERKRTFRKLLGGSHDHLLMDTALRAAGEEREWRKKRQRREKCGRHA